MIGINFRDARCRVERAVNRRRDARGGHPSRLDPRLYLIYCFPTSMAKEPNRYHGLAGAAKAAAVVGAKEKARAHYATLVALAGGSNSDRPELAAAREFLAKK